ncbi:hypothetical protein V1477_006404 [Vespula maculifrons]|uniref:Uncharacterized protein n=1 Tax=Vespula maculifrons TaxID=7453 RepID=A0ABD2CL61_VESMC
MFFSLFPLNRYYSATIGSICTQKDGRRVRDEPFQTAPENVFFFVPFKPLLLGYYWFDLDEKNMGLEGATSPLNDPGLVLLGAIRARRALLNGPGPVLLGAIVSEKKILKEKCFFPLVPLNRYNSAHIGPICAIVSEKKIVKENVFFLCSLYTVLTRLLLVQFVRKKYGRRGCDGPFPLTLRTRRALSNDPRSVLLGAIVSEKKIVKEKCFFPLFPLNRYNSAPIGSIWTKKIWA